MPAERATSADLRRGRRRQSSSFFRKLAAGDRCGPYWRQPLGPNWHRCPLMPGVGDSTADHTPICVKWRNKCPGFSGATSWTLATKFRRTYLGLLCTVRCWPSSSHPWNNGTIRCPTRSDTCSSDPYTHQNARRAQIRWCRVVGAKISGWTPMRSP